MGKKEESRWIENGADVETRVEVIEAGPWTFDNRPLIVKPWTDDANLEREDMVEVPVWVRFPNLKLHVVHNNADKMASIIGKPLFMDRMTAERERLAYARGCECGSEDGCYTSGNGALAG
ncbi:hypothetical protein LguiA_030315 [Lonicera macranthoides]